MLSTKMMEWQRLELIAEIPEWEKALHSIAEALVENLQLRKVVRQQLKTAFSEIPLEEKVVVGEYLGQPGHSYIEIHLSGRNYYPPPMLVFPTLQKAVFANETAWQEHRFLAGKLKDFLSRLGYEILMIRGDPKEIIDLIYGRKGDNAE